MFKCDLFTKTGSGQTQGNLKTERCVFLREPARQLNLTTEPAIIDYERQIAHADGISAGKTFN